MKSLKIEINGETKNIADVISQYNPKMTKYEKMIIGARKDETNMDDAGVLDNLLNSVVVITGSDLHPTLQAEFKLEFLNFISKFGYSNLSPDEIKLAFQLNCIEDIKLQSGAYKPTYANSSSFLNLDFISKVLASYFVLRGILDQKIQNAANGY